MVQRVTFPVATGWLINHLDTVTEYPVSDSIPDGKEQFVKVRRAGGPADRRLLVDAPQFIVECYARFEDDAEAFCLEIRSHIHAMAGRTINGVTVKRVVEYGGPVSLPDDRTPDLSRFTFNVAVHLRGGTITD